MSVQAHLLPTTVRNAGSQAMCGYEIIGVQPPDDAEPCTRCVELSTKPQLKALLVDVTRHEHTWESAGGQVMPGGWSPVYRCKICGDEVADISILRKVVG